MIMHASLERTACPKHAELKLDSTNGRTDLLWPFCSGILLGNRVMLVNNIVSKNRFLICRDDYRVCPSAAAKPGRDFSNYEKRIEGRLVCWSGFCNTTQLRCKSRVRRGDSCLRSRTRQPNLLGKNRLRDALAFDQREPYRGLRGVG